MATPAEATSMATQADATSTATQREPRLHQVHILYLKGEKHEKGQELEVHGYPPKDLQERDVVVFIPFPPGELKLTFEHGSNFTDAKTLQSEIVGQKPQVVKRKMMRAELDALEARADKEEWSPERRAIGVKENAFPFMCELALTETGSNPKAETTVSKPTREIYRGGFPKKIP